MSFQNLIDEYTPEYCHLLELAYGKNWMSDGGDAAIDTMFCNETLVNKKILDVGSGLGGAAFCLAQHFKANVVGLEINPWLVEEATRRIPAHLQSHLSFKLYDDMNRLPFADNEFDIIFSHGVLVHVADKQPLFNEFNRILNSHGQLAIYDWVTPDVGQWGPLLLKMCKTEGLTLEITTLEQYKKVLENSGFNNIRTENKNDTYAQYNWDVAERLESEALKKEFLAHFDDQTRKELKQGHEQIAQSMEQGELLARNIFADVVKN